MRRIIAALCCVLSVALPALMPLQTAYATDAGTTPSSEPSAQSGSGDGTAAIVPIEKISSDTADVNKRLSEYKKTYTAQLTEAVKTRLSQRCEASQTKLKTVSDRTETVVTDRMKRYNDMLTKLKALTDGAVAQKVDAKDLIAATGSLQTKVTTLEQQLTVYRQALVDVHALKCKDDPAAFKAALEAARKAQTSIIVTVKDIRSYYTATIKPLLDALKTAVDATKTTTTTGGN